MQLFFTSFYYDRIVFLQNFKPAAQLHVQAEYTSLKVEILDV